MAPREYMQHAQTHTNENNKRNCLRAAAASLSMCVLLLENIKARIYHTE
jgi:hypothetical protein